MVVVFHEKVLHCKPNLTEQMEPMELDHDLIEVNFVDVILPAYARISNLKKNYQNLSQKINKRIY